jgi:predicted CoA-binding protein
MTTKREIDDFLAQKTLAIVGVSRSGKKFGNVILKDLTRLGYRLLPIHPDASEIDGVSAFPSFGALPEPVGGVIVVVPPARAEQVVKDAAAHGIRRVWLQQGAASPEVVKCCQAEGMSVVHGHCVLMFTQPTTSWLHGAHRWIWELIGRAPRH